MLKDYQEKILGLFINQETLLADIYQALADRFPEHSDFFTEIANDELSHAGYLKKAYYLEKEGKVTFDEGRVKTYTLKAFIEYIEKIKDTILAPGTSLVKSLVYALDIEKSILEKDLFTHFTGINKDIDNIFKKLTEETKLHINKIESMLNKHRPK